MRNFSIFAAFATLFVVCAPAHASGVGETARYDRQIVFQNEPVSDEALEQVVGRALPPHLDANVKAMADQESLSVFQQLAQSGRVTMDNWWAQTGAALIDNNILAGQMRGYLP